MWITGTVIQCERSSGTLTITTTCGELEISVADIFQRNVDKVWEGAKVSAYLSPGGNHDSPRAELFCLEPDHVIDVTELAECITDSGDVDNLAILRRFQPKTPSYAALRGSLINTVFDILVSNPHLPDSQLVASAIESKSLPIAVHGRSELASELTDVLPLLRKTLGTWSNKTLTVEPHVVSGLVGLQGRFDILVADKEDKTFEIIELKSGKAPSRTRTNHAAQVAAYALLFELSEGFPPQNCQVWYVADAEHPLRSLPAGSIATLQKRVLRLRNEVVVQERSLAMRDFRQLRAFGTNTRSAGGMVGDFEHTFIEAYRSCDAVSRTAMQAWLSFLFSEQMEARTGSSQKRSASDLWLATTAEKEESSTVLSGLRLDAERSTERNMHLVFLLPHSFPRTRATALRPGDLVILHTQAHETGITYRLLKGVLRHVDDRSVSVSLRNKQVSWDDLCSLVWTMEQDVSDAGLKHLTSGLFRFLDAPIERRHTILGIPPPRFSSPPNVDVHTLMPSQACVVRQSLAAQDWFLIQGPPGTGKTSIILRSIVKNLLHEPSQRILVLAYTNRAVNEICDVLSKALPDGMYMRHGTSAGISDHLHRFSIPHVAAHCSPGELAERLRTTRCIVSTIHSVHSQPDIMRFGGFTTAIIDEASQVLDVHLCGILAEVDKFILIGDHAQLPPVITQSADKLQVRSDLLTNIGLQHLGMSIFERLAMRCEKMGWEGALATLEHQGRMHEDVMAFPSQAFYGNRLKVCNEWQVTPSPLPWHDVIPHRACYVHAASPESEVRTVVRLATLIVEASESSKSDFSIGIISPFRVHNRRIQDHLPDHVQEHVTVDTVERFQGSQRDVIMYCVGASTAQEFEMVRSDARGIDRKLNVASTRARHQFIMIGNTAFYSASRSYALAKELLNELVFDTSNMVRH